MKTTISEIKDTLNGINSILHIAKETIMKNKYEDRAIETIQK